MKTYHHLLSKNVWDKVGISASIMCAVHCLLMPVLLPFIALSHLKIISEPFFENGMITFAVLVASFALTRGYCSQHKQVLPFYFYAAGMTFVLLGKFLIAEDLEALLVPIGAFFFAVSHSVNLLLCKTCSSCKK